jgi:tetratricopeptide (TPR) repeat protein
VPLFEAQNALQEKAGSKQNLATGLENLADDQLKIGTLAAADDNLRRDIELAQEIGDEFYQATGHEELGRLLAYTGAFEEAGRELDESYEYDSQHNVRQGECVDWAYRALRALLMGNAETALEAARRARELADVQHVEYDIIRAEWLLGAAQRARGELGQAEAHLDEALRRCRRINMVDHEPDILLEMARVGAQGVGVGTVGAVGARVGAQRVAPLPPQPLAHEALAIANRCGYRLKQADCHNFLARLALDAGNLPEARQHAQTARDYARCDGPPHRYEVAFQEAERLLREIGG